ncbi:MAG: type II toxin-antitoxin system RelE/ParE family toxin [Flavobacterium sp.]|nr:type II toxin-antitoxin system RelE/ParE family toxin [Flavobacterium sp.]
MPYTLSKAAIIKEDVAEALDYYDAISESLAFRFEKELNEAFDKLEQQPYSYFKINGKYRRIVLPSFPYMVVYRIEEQTVIIIAVFHQKSIRRN